MFGLLEKFSLSRLKKQYEFLMSQAVQAQRNGKMDKFAKLSQEADELYKKIQQIEANKK